MYGHVRVTNNQWWLLIAISIYAIRYLVLNHYARLDENQYEKKLTVFRFCVATTATVWGLSGILLFPAEITYQKFLLLTLIGVCGGSIVTYAIDRFCVIIFPAIILTLSITNFIQSGSPFNGPILLNAVIFIGFISLASIGIAKRLEENIALRLSEVISREKLKRLSQRQQLHIEQTPLAVIEIDTAFIITSWNPSATNIFGFTDQEAIGSHISMILSGSTVETFQSHMSNLINSGTSTQLQTSNVKKDGSMIYCEWFNTALKDDYETVHSIAALIQDETAYVTARKKIEEHAYYDVLTQLPNSRLLNDRIEQAQLRSNRNKVFSCLLYVDIDNFKFVNDTYGHSAGDQLLVTLATRFKKVLRASDTAARIGGDEFIILLENIHADKTIARQHCTIVAKKILNSITKSVKLKQSNFNTTASLGICLFSDENINTECIIKRADSAMYTAKQAGKNQFKFYDSVIQTQIEYKNKLKNDLQFAIQQKELHLHLQPQVNAQKQIIGAESLLRWKHPEYHFVSPTEFIPLAEETKQIVDIGSWVLTQACKQLASWQKASRTKNLTISVNVSAVQFNQADFVKTTLNIIKKSKCNPNFLIIELTESSTVESFEDIIPKMNQLRAIGVSFSLDDFGTGQSSLSVLKKLPLDELKIDQSFTKALLEDEESDVFVKTIIAMGKRLNLSVIAEGVETEEQAQFLLNSGCDNLQGYLFGKSVSLRDFNKQLKEHNVIAVNQPDTNDLVAIAN